MLAFRDSRIGIAHPDAHPVFPWLPAIRFLLSIAKHLQHGERDGVAPSCVVRVDGGEVTEYAVLNLHVLTVDAYGLTYNEGGIGQDTDVGAEVENAFVGGRRYAQHG